MLLLHETLALSLYPYLNSTAPGVDNTCYWKRENEKELLPYFAAKGFCAEEGGRLLSIRNEVDYDMIKER